MSDLIVSFDNAQIIQRDLTFNAYLLQQAASGIDKEGNPPWLIFYLPILVL